MTPATLTAVAAVGAITDTKVIGLTLHRGKFGDTKKAPTDPITVDADKALLGVRKTILVAPELKTIRSIDHRIDKYLALHALPIPLARNVYGIPLAIAQEVESHLRAFKRERDDAADVVAAVYLTRVAETCARLRVMQSAIDYPTPDAFRATFYMGWRYRAAVEATPESLKLVDVDLFEGERRRIETQLAAVAEECQQAMRAGLAALVHKLVENLTPGPDGKPRRFHPSHVEHLTEFLATFAARNVTNDVTLAGLASKAQQLLAGVDPARLLDDAAQRAPLAAQFEGVLAALTPLVGPRRLIGEEV